nr:hypothetical protein [Tanacetum cinerariifolium]
NENSFKPVPQTTANADGTSTSTIPCLVTTEEKALKKNDVKARSMLLMALPNEHLLTFSQYNDAKTLFEAITSKIWWYFHKTGKKITINRSDTAGYDKTTVECFNCHKMGHFARECKSLRNQESRPRNQDNSRKTVIVEDTSSKAMVAIDGAGFDWSYMADDEVPTNIALMAFSDLEIKKNPNASIIEDWISDSDEDESDGRVLKTNNVQHKPEQANQPWKVSQIPRNNKINWNEMRTQKLGIGFQFTKKAWHMTGNISYLTDFKEHNGGYVAFGGELKVNIVMNEFYEEKGIKREYNVARTPQQNRVDERRNMTLIEASRTMLTDSKLPTTFWVEAVNTACYVQNRVLVVKPHFKTPYELFKGRSPTLSFMRPFGCHVTILNTLDQLGKFDGKSNEGIFVGYSTTSKAFRVYNIRTRKVEENLHITFLENKPMTAGDGPEWLFNIDALSKSMNYAPVFAGTNSNDFAGKGASFDAASDGHNKDKHGPSQAGESDNQKRPNAESSTNTVNTATPTYDDSPNDPLMLDLEDARIFDDAYDDRDEGVEADYNKLGTVIPMEPKKVTQALDDESWIEAMQEELLQFKLLNVWTLMDLPHGKRSIRTKWVYRNKRDHRGIIVRNKPACNEVIFGLCIIYGIHCQQMDVKSAFLYGTIEEEVYVSQPLGFVDPEFTDRVYKVKKAFYGLHQAHKAWYETLSTYLLDNGFRRGTIDKTLFIKKIKNDILLVQVEQRKKGIFLNQDKYVSDILKKFGFSSVKSASTPMETHKPLSKDANGTNVDVHLYRYLNGQTTLGLWYPKDSPLDLIAYFDSDYAVASLDRKSTTGGCRFLGSRLISWQYKKQIIVANSTTKAEYIVASNCCRQVIWMIEKLDKDKDVNLVETLLNIRRSPTKDKGKMIMQETELPKKLKKIEMIQLSLDEELAQNLYVEELAKEAARQDQEMYNLEKALELQRQLDQRKEDVAKGDQAKKIDWNDPIGGYKQSHFKGMKYEDIRPIFERLYMRIIPDKDIAIDAIPLATKPSVIVEYKIVKEGKISTYLIVRVDGKTKRNCKKNVKLEAEYYLTNVTDFFVFSNKEAEYCLTNVTNFFVFSKKKVVPNCCNGVSGVAALLVSDGSDLKLISVAINGNRLMMENMTWLYMELGMTFYPVI